MTLTFDLASLLAHAPGDMRLADVERALAASGLTLDVEGAAGSDETVARWLAGGARGARDGWLDPADHLLAGIDLRLHDGREVRVRPSPRRAVGPDLVALVVGMGERFARVESAWLRVHRVGAPRPAATFRSERDPAVSPGEASLLDEVERALRADSLGGG